MIQFDEHIFQTGWNHQLVILSLSMLGMQKEFVLVTKVLRCSQFISCFFEKKKTYHPPINTNLLALKLSTESHYPTWFFLGGACIEMILEGPRMPVESSRLERQKFMYLWIAARKLSISNPVIT